MRNAPSRNTLTLTTFYLTRASRARSVEALVQHVVVEPGEAEDQDPL